MLWVEKMPNKKEQMDRIHEALDESKKPIEIFKKVSPRVKELRKLLLQVHEDYKIAEFLRDRKYYQPLYDPEPDNEFGPYLDWAVSENNEHNVDFKYVRPMKYTELRGVFIKDEHDKFNTGMEELPDLFPFLTADRLEECIIASFQNEREYRKGKEKERQEGKLGKYTKRRWIEAWIRENEQ